jgi:hypothetical protein
VTVGPSFIEPVDSWKCGAVPTPTAQGDAEKVRLGGFFDWRDEWVVVLGGPWKGGEEAVNYWASACLTAIPGDRRSSLHSWEHEPHTMTSTTMSRRPGTVETRRTRPTPCPHAGHFRSIFIDGVARGVNSGDLRILGALTQVKVMRGLLVVRIRIPRLVRSCAPLARGSVALVTGLEPGQLREDIHQFAVNFLRIRAKFRRPLQQETDLRSCV